MKQSLITFRDLVLTKIEVHCIVPATAESQGLQDLGLGSWLRGRCRCREAFKKS